MEPTIHIDGARGIAILAVRGTIPPNLFAVGLKLLEAHAEYRPGMGRVWDLREGEFGGFTASDLQAIAETVRAYQEKNPSSRVAVVVGRDVDFGIARMFQFREAEEMPSAMRPFRDIDEATAWAAGETGE